MNSCFHCGEPVPKGENRWLEIDGEHKPFCCAGCEAVSRLILTAGMDDFYRFRTELSPRVEPADVSRWHPFDTPNVLAGFARVVDGVHEASLQLDDIRCAACGWLVEKTLGERTGVSDIRLNPVTGRVVLRWRQDETKLSSLLAALDSLGFRPRPLGIDEREAQDDNERQGLLRRLAVAGFGMMQAMMYGVAMYVGIDMSEAFEHFFRHVSLLIATPVVFYAAAPFFRGALRSARAGTLGMDVPLSIAILVAYTASLVNAFRGSGEVYFDSVSMFVFLLLVGRYVEAIARHRVADTSRALSASLPATATRVRNDGVSEDVPLAALRAGDIVRVTRGSVVPADGRIIEGVAEVEESLLTGEAQSVTRRAGEELLAGAMNLGSPFSMRIARTGSDTLISGIARLLDRVQGTRPRMARHADRLARYFVGAVLITSGLTALTWAMLDAGRAFEITLSVLIVTCPCALGLAVPVALTAATNAIARRGVLTVNGDALEQLDGITDVVFDKTGTLTLGKPRIHRVVVTGELPEEDCLALAAGMEAQANHPLALAFLQRAATQARMERVEQIAGEGLRGRHDGNWFRLGRPEYAGFGATAPDNGSWIALSDEHGVLAWFELLDALRDDAVTTVRQLQQAGLRIHLLSGDSESTVDKVAQHLGIGDARGRLRPEDKLALIEELRDAGARVLAIGDGINDAPVLAGADVSIAMASGAALAQSSADFVLTGSLHAVSGLLEHARRARRVMRQNLRWAFSYNMLAVPLAATGFVTPWMAAIGMSASSLLVTLNALRLNRVRASLVSEETLRPAHSS